MTKSKTIRIVPKGRKVSSSKNRGCLISSTCVITRHGHRHDEKPDEHNAGPCYKVKESLVEVAYRDGGFVVNRVLEELVNGFIPCLPEEL